MILVNHNVASEHEVYPLRVLQIGLSSVHQSRGSPTYHRTIDPAASQARSRNLLAMEFWETP